MTNPDANDLDKRARAAHRRLTAAIWRLPDVQMIDVGKDPEGLIDSPVIRVYLRSAGANIAKIPAEIDGVAVRIVRSDFRLE
jgi:hypothetical protein